MQPDLPRSVQLTAPKWYVVSEARIVNPCKATLSFDPKKYNDDGTEKFKRPKTCDLSERENPDWPEGYTYLDRFLDDMQELKRYIKQLGEVVIYYRNVTMPDGEKGMGVGIKTPEAIEEVRG